jgi:TldD protein
LSSSFFEEQKIFVTDFKPIKYTNRNKVIDSYFEKDKEVFVDLLKRGANAINELNIKEIVLTKSSFSFARQEVIFFNSLNKTFKRITERARYNILAYASNENGLEVAHNSKGTQKDFSYFLNEINIEEIAKNTAKTAHSLLYAKDCPSGKMPVVIGPGWGGVLFHEACGHPLEASSVSKDLSVFSNKIGEQIASNLVSAYDDSTIPGAWGSIDIDDEGNLGEKRELIKDGILKNYLTDYFGGLRMNCESNGAGRRASYSYSPVSRMSNTYIDNGNSTPEEIISNTKLGLYTVGFNGGSVNPSTGEFNFACSEAYIIRDGKICEPVKGATLIGKSNEILHNIDMVGNDLDFGDGMCGAQSGSIPVCVGQPTIRIKEITVGGTGGELK